jgi:DNA helicase-4
VKYCSGLIGMLFGNFWNISTDQYNFLYKKRGEIHQIDYLDIKTIRHKKGILWNTVTITTQKFTFNLKGLPAKVAKSLSKDLESSAKHAIIARILGDEKLLSKIETKTKQLLESDRYISNIDLRNWISQIPNIDDLTHPLFDPKLLPKQVQLNIELFLEIIKPNSSYLKKINEKFVNRSIQQFSHLFKQLEKFPLTEEQMHAAIINEDRNLLIAAAGSGKTSTIVAKAIYLICAGLAKPEEILVLAYNKYAQIELADRFIKLTGVVPEYKEPLKVKTFHSYGYEIISTFANSKPKISKFATAEKKYQSRLFTNLTKNLYDNDPLFMTAWREFFLVDKHPNFDLFKIKSQQEYEDFLKELGAKRRTLPYGYQLLIPTIDGKEVKSFEEAKISNWLVLNGVEYEYEKRYINPSNLNENINYKPDFYYPKADLYHEHFAINSDGETPPFIGNDYLDKIDWKRKTHQKNNTKLIETHSAHFRDDTIFDRLEKILRENNVSFNPLKKSKIDNLISKAFVPEIDLLLFISFVRHFKANNAPLEQIRKKAFDLPEQKRVSLFLNIFEALYKEYSKHLKKVNEIDFEDQINIACNLLEINRYKHQFKYVLVDEFQDISQDRKRMLQALLNQNENIKLFAVGDDWQSIYRFTSADLKIMTNFSSQFGSTSQNYLTQTYRSFQGIVDVACTFIQRNKEQLKKNVKATKNINKDQIIIFGYQDEEDQTKQVNDLLNKLNAIDSKKKRSVFLLARYGHLRPNHLKKYPDLELKFSTIHASKGLQADYVILLNVETGCYGFPSTITDDPLMDLVIPKPETYPYAEERRLMYVALTRAKRGVFLFSNQNKISPFVAELAEIDGVDVSSIL